jgi:hypothetical protein
MPPRGTEVPREGPIETLKKSRRDDFPSRLSREDEICSRVSCVLPKRHQDCTGGATRSVSSISRFFACDDGQREHRRLTIRKGSDAA